MSGGLMQLVAYGAQDVYLTGNPQITFFKVVYRRYTNFAIETVAQTFTSGTAKPGATDTAVLISRSGDLVSNLTLMVSLAAQNVPTAQSTDYVAYVRRLGHMLIDEVRVDIGGARIDRHYGMWLDIWYELTHTTGKERAYNELIGDVPELTSLQPAVTGLPARNVYVPLIFWFCKNTGLALPLVALQYHEVKIYFNFRTIDRLFVTQGNVSYLNFNSTSLFNNVQLLIDYVYLDSEERRRFAQVSHEYLIEQLQRNVEGFNDYKKQSKITFNHPTKELVWVSQLNNYTVGAKYLAYSNSSDWTSALNNAVVNLISGMIPANQQTTGGTIQAYTAGSTASVTLADGSGHTILITILGTSGTLNLLIDSNAVFNVNIGGVTTNLYTLINEVDILIDGISVPSVANPATNVTVAQVVSIVPNNHNLTVQQLSVPTTSASQDNRYPAAKLLDVYAPLPHNYGTYVDGSQNPCELAQITLNGYDRTPNFPGEFFNYLQPYYKHSNSPPDGVNIYSFAINPEQHQPSGTLNFSRIDNAYLNITHSTNFMNLVNIKGGSINFYVFGVNYNVLRIMSGMGGVAYAS